MNENIESCQREKRTYDEEGVREAVRLFLKSIGWSRTSNCIRCASITCCLSMAWPMWATFPPRMG